MGIKDAHFDAGIELRRTMFGPGGSDDIVDHTTDVNDKLEDYVTRVCFGDIWQRPGLELADRSKITLAMLLATGKSHEIRVHMRGALQNGVTPLQLREIVVHSVLYCGIPTAVEGVRAMHEVFADLGISTELDGEAAASMAAQHEA
ncbi:MAG TPA: carboxymuconolactone decarboxylase family protein [Enteractinococcus sp.]